MPMLNSLGLDLLCFLLNTAVACLRLSCTLQKCAAQPEHHTTDSLSQREQLAVTPSTVSVCLLRCAPAGLLVAECAAWGLRPAD
eukprot:12339-Heterococcus_DN1.PRE.1